MDERKGFRVLVFLAAFCCLMFELIISRVADFYLDSRNGFVAIPITFLGLALGSLHVHFRKRIVERFSVRGNLIVLAAVSFLTLTVVFLVFSRYLTATGAYSIMATLQHSLIKSLFFVGVFIIPFYFFGRILTVCYHLNRDRIGAIYSADFFGASLACFLTPILFHVFNLPGVLFAFTCGLSLLVLLFLRLPWKATGALFVALAALNAGFLYFVLYADNHTNFETFFAGEGNVQAVEFSHGWNEFSRVSVIQTPGRGGRPHFTIIHDNAQSNVNVDAYVPGVYSPATRISTVQAAFLLGKPVSDVLVMFAGCGAEMIAFNYFSGGQAKITGVELNPLVKRLAVETPVLKDYRLQEFYDLPNVDLIIAEGRSFLIRDPKKYDVIFIGSKAGTRVQLTGHSRKYLDTEEAYSLYLDHLKEGGILHFDHQSLPVPIATLKQVFEQRKQAPFDKSVIIFKSRGRDDMLVAPQGFAREEVQHLIDFESKDSPGIDYAPYLKESGGRYAGMIKASVESQAFRVTDDRPFDWNLYFQGYRLIPSREQIKDELYFHTWLKITTLVVVGALGAMFILLVYLPRATRPPAATLVYLVLTGFCYMLIEVTFMAKFELFLQDLLVSMASILTVFLLSSGLGSILFERISRRLPIRLFPFIVACVVMVSLLAIDSVTHRCMSVPLVFRLLIVVALTAPTGICLGVFYPYAVAGLVRNGFERVVPITYGISTLASVLGATYAMTLMVRFGYDTLLYQAIAGYVSLGVLMILYFMVARRNVFCVRE